MNALQGVIYTFKHLKVHHILNCDSDFKIKGWGTFAKPQ